MIDISYESSLWNIFYFNPYAWKESLFANMNFIDSYFKVSATNLNWGDGECQFITNISIELFSIPESNKLVHSRFNSGK
jgi:hypothetical protein